MPKADEPPESMMAKTGMEWKARTVVVEEEEEDGKHKEAKSEPSSKLVEQSVAVLLMSHMVVEVAE